MSRLFIVHFVTFISFGIVFTAPVSDEDEGENSPGWMEMVEVATKLISFQNPKIAHLIQKITKNMQGIPADHVRELLNEKCTSMAQAWTCFDQVKEILSENVNEIYETAELFKGVVF